MQRRGAITRRSVPGGRYEPHAPRSLVPQGWARARRSSRRRARSSSPAALLRAAASPISPATRPAIFGLAGEPELGLSDWLEAGAAAPVEALDRMLVEVAPGIALVPFGAADRTLRPRPAAEAGAALAVALRDLPVPVVADCGAADDPATRALVEVADVVVVVIRGCYLALRRAVHVARCWRVRRAPCSSTSRGARCRGARSPTCSACRCSRGSRCATRSHERSTPVCWQPVCPTSLARAATIVVSRTGIAPARGAAA